MRIILKVVFSLTAIIFLTIAGVLLFLDYRFFVHRHQKVGLAEWARLFIVLSAVLSAVSLIVG